MRQTAHGLYCRYVVAVVVAAVVVVVVIAVVVVVVPIAVNASLCW